MHIADWYATFAKLAGLAYPTDEVAAAAGLPPLDSRDAWSELTRTLEEEGDAAADGGPPRTHDEIPLSGDALLDARSGLKLLRALPPTSATLLPKAALTCAIAAPSRVPCL